MRSQPILSTYCPTHHFKLVEPQTLTSNILTATPADNESHIMAELSGGKSLLQHYQGLSPIRSNAVLAFAATTIQTTKILLNNGSIW